MEMSTFESNFNDNATQVKRLFGRERAIHEILGGGEVANILLWRDKRISGVIFISVMAMWFLFDVAEYTFVTFVCHSTITAMLIVFIWSNGARAFEWNPPHIPNILLEESTLITNFCQKLNYFLSRLIYIAYGHELRLFCLAIVTISILSTIGNYITTMNLLFIVFLGIGMLPCLYENNEEEVDYIFDVMSGLVSKGYGMLYQNVVLIPTWPLKEKKFN
uniref:reticulon-like protein B9 n=1 Tax=Erigeron canadensis TaxID=72917 RepID=UPI001CB8EA7E|nr:reticulon-like protein B9 [Erigeron canadensis]